MINKQSRRLLTSENIYLISSAHVKVKCVARTRSGDVWKAPRQKSFHDGRVISKLMADQLIVLEISLSKFLRKKTSLTLATACVRPRRRRAQDNSAIFINTSRDFEYFFDTHPTLAHMSARRREKEKKPQLDIK